MQTEATEIPRAFRVAGERILKKKKVSNLGHEKGDDEHLTSEAVVFSDGLWTFDFVALYSDSLPMHCICYPGANIPDCGRLAG